MSTRKLIIAALLCAVALLVAGTVWLLTLNTTVNEIRDDPRTTSTSTSTSTSSSTSTQPLP